MFTYGMIADTLTDLNNRNKKVLDTNSDVFLSAYKKTMEEVHSEIKNIKSKVSDDRIK